MRLSKEMPKLLLPRGYLSPSQMEVFLTNPERYRREYFENKDKFSTKFTEFGTKVHKLAEENKHKDILPDLVIYDVRELNIRQDVLGVPTFSKIDSYDPVNNVFRDLKTGLSPWTKAKVIKSNQFLFYAVVLKHKYGKAPEYCHVDWAETKIGEPVGDQGGLQNEPGLNLTGRLFTFQRNFDEREIERMENLILKTAEQISEAYINFLKEI
jgi:hypothetical protein